MLKKWAEAVLVDCMKIMQGGSLVAGVVVGCCYHSDGDVKVMTGGRP